MALRSNPSDRLTPDARERPRVVLGRLREYEGIPEVDDIFRDHGHLLLAFVLLAKDDGQVLGLASYTLLWPAAGADTSLYLKELFVREAARRRGVGRALMAALRQEAAALSCSRIEWTGDTDNPTALNFYAALGAQPRKGKVFYRVDG